MPVPENRPPWGRYPDPDTYAYELLKAEPRFWNGDNWESRLDYYLGWLDEISRSGFLSKTIYTPPQRAAEFLFNDAREGGQMAARAFLLAHPGLATSFTVNGIGYVRAGASPLTFFNGRFAAQPWWVYDEELGYGIAAQPFYGAIGYDPNERDLLSYGVEALMILFVAGAVSGSFGATGEIVTETATEAAGEIVSETVLETVSEVATEEILEIAAEEIAQTVVEAASEEISEAALETAVRESVEQAVAEIVTETGAGVTESAIQKTVEAVIKKAAEIPMTDAAKKALLSVVTQEITRALTRSQTVTRSPITGAYYFGPGAAPGSQSFFGTGLNDKTLLIAGAGIGFVLLLAMVSNMVSKSASHR